MIEQEIQENVPPTMGWQIRAWVPQSLDLLRTNECALRIK